jgi:hypothetical protein
MSQLVRANEHIARNRAFGTQELNDVLEKAMQRESKFSTKKSFAPSGLGYSGSCPRYWYYAFNGANFEYDTAATAVANMNAGTDAGARLAKLLDDAGILVDAEQEVNTIEHETYHTKRYMEYKSSFKLCARLPVGSVAYLYVRHESRQGILFN